MPRFPMVLTVASLLVATAAGAATEAPSRSREECAAAHPVALGRSGKDVPWVVTSDGVTRAMLSMAKVTPQDLVLDLGTGDGKIAIAAAKQPFGARAIGIEYDADLAKLAACLVEAEGVADRVRIVQGDIFREDFGDASVVAMYLLPQLNLCVRHRILALAPGTRVVSHQYKMADWEPEQSIEILGRNVYLWTVPARVEGTWEFRDSGGTPLTVDLRQTFEKVAGEVARNGARKPLGSATLRGNELRFTYADAAGAVRFSGTVRGREITGTLLTGMAARTVVGRPVGALPAAAWAAMPPDCSRYYDR